MPEEFRNRGRVERGLRQRLKPEDSVIPAQAGEEVRARTKHGKHTKLMLGTPFLVLGDATRTWSFCPPGGPLLATGDHRTSELENSV